MNYRNMIVCLDDSAHSAKRLQFALELARRNGAHLTGLHLSYMPQTPYLAYDGVEPLFIRLEAELDKRQSAAREGFEAAASAAGVSTGWLAARSVDMEAIIAFARVSDLIIAGQPDPADTATYIGEGFPGRFLLGVARPVLFTPFANPLKASFDSIIVAWNGSREATRALRDAMPLLHAAARVTVLTVRAENWLGAGAVPLPDIAAYLERHGIVADVLENITHEDAGEWLLARAENMDMPADLIVAGGYGHSRLSELVLGGVTRTLLHEMNVPVLLSH
ncbi:MAG: universal stress protein [Moraxellaceae bacterium]|jgi:nucleotide-binding universal stress UspA family protein|nr:universal stress protein [Moraxellaceae bacterium]